MSAAAAEAHQEPPPASTDAGDEEEAGGSLKKRRFLEPSGLDYPKRGKHARFLAFHFDVLQSLYSKNNDHQATDANTSGVVDASVWEATQMFLEQRDRLMQAKEEAECMKGIHDESLRFTTCEERDPTGRDHSNRNKATAMGNNSVSPTAATPHARNVANRKLSPVISQKPSFRGSFLSSQTSLHSPSTGGTAAAGGPTAAIGGVPHRFDIVARLIGRRHQLVESTFQQQAQPFQPLLGTTEARIVALQHELHHLQQSCAAADQKCLSDLLHSTTADAPEKPAASNIMKEEVERRNRKTTLEVKIRLWSLLVQDLREALGAGAGQAN